MVSQKSKIKRNVSSKPVILTFINNYLPGYKAGGIPRAMINTIENLCDYMEFWVVTRDRDLGDTKPYDCIKKNQWQHVGSANVYYLSPRSSTLKKIRNLLLTTKHDILYLNSFFDPFTIKVLLIKSFSRTSFKPVIVAPRGEFAWSALRLKYLKKFVYVQLARILGLYKHLNWHASTKFEKADIMKVMNIKNDLIHIASDLPKKIIQNNTSSISSNQPTSNYEELRLIFLSRIARIKNLDYALLILSKVKAKVLFDIYGPQEDMKYWKECQKLINQLPVNIKVNYMGIINPNQVVQVFSSYDLFLFPSGGESYGHVIAESLTSGTPVLISDKTPWENLRNLNFGWDISLNQMDSFVEVIEKYALLSFKDKIEKRKSIKSRIGEYLLDTEVLEANRQLFLKQLTL